MHMRPIAIALLVGMVASALAGDEVDYSAPYLTLENGQLVTKYPAKEHTPGEDPAQATADIAGQQESAESPPPWPIFAAAAIGLAGLLFLLRRRLAPGGATGP